LTRRVRPLTGKPFCFARKLTQPTIRREPLRAQLTNLDAFDLDEVALSFLG